MILQFYIFRKCYKLKASVLQYIIKQMPLFFNYLRIPDCFIGWNGSSQKIEYEMQRILIHFTNDCDENQLNYSNDLPAIANKNYAAHKPFETDFSTVIGNAKLRPSFFIC